MNVVVALDSFKGSLTAEAACALVARTLRTAHPEWTVAECPMADGGEGTAAALVAAAAGEWRAVDGVTGPLPDMKVGAGFGWLPQSRAAVVEMAAASGLPLLAPARRNPLLATTAGTGELMAAALRLQPRKLLLTLGGSATVDAGAGAARALGWRFLDAAGRDVPDGGGALHLIRRIVPPPTGKFFSSAIQNPQSQIQNSPAPAVQALCDVRNPLCGPEGAAAVFGPQKGATPAMVEMLDTGLRNLAACIRRDLGIDVLDLPGGGAAGGFGAGAVAFFGAELTAGIAAVTDACGLRARLAGADWVITGEGAFDSQSLNGKVVSGVRDAARAAGVRVAVLAGRVRLQEAQWRREGIAAAAASAPEGMPDAEAFARTEELLAAAVGRLALG